MDPQTTARSRCVALVGPYLSGKTTLLESILHATGAIARKGSVRDGTTVGDAAPEARTKQMTVEITAAETTYHGDRWTFLDCPGSIEFLQDAQNACIAADLAVVVCDPEPGRALTVAPLLRFLDAHAIPHILLINKMDTASDRVREILAALQGVSQRPLVLRQVPIREGETLVGYVDLVSERAYRYKPGQASDLISLPADIVEREKEARQAMIEALADHDDDLLEQVLEDRIPAPQEIYGYVAKELRDDLIVPVLLGSALNDGGVRRLLKALRHDTPGLGATLARRGLEAGSDPVVQVFKTAYVPHTGKIALSRVLQGAVKEGMTLGGERLGSLSRPFGAQLSKIPAAEAGDVVGIGRVDAFRTGDLVAGSGTARAADWPAPLPPIFALAVQPENRQDEVKLTSAIARLIEEDASYSIEHDTELHQLLLWGQGEQHLQVALSRLSTKWNVNVRGVRPLTPYRETIRRGVSQHARHKRQTGGHGQFADIQVEIAPLPRGEGFAYGDRVVGGAVPKQYIPAVESGVRDYMARGPLGFPVVDFAVTLVDGKFHAVDSSEMAFKTAGRLAMVEGMPKCQPVLLEPILKVTVHVPNDYTSNVQRLLSGRRGQLLGYDARQGWPGWDSVAAFLPQSEMHDLIVELRSLTMGVGSFDWSFDHLQELTGRLADDVVKARMEAAQ
ncbi:MAG: elongation factor G [Alphaproteobacteria bacterium]